MPFPFANPIDRSLSSDVLNRLASIPLTSTSEIPSKENILGRDTRHVLKHIFPRQFGLKSVFEIYPNLANSADIDLNTEISVRQFFYYEMPFLESKYM